eukprot:SAG11_NODE_5422_length_1565_cov_0.961801_1_plen_74_part_00
MVPADDGEVVNPDCEAMKVFAPDQDGQEKAEALKQAKFAGQRAVSDTIKLSAGIIVVPDSTKTESRVETQSQT